MIIIIKTKKKVNKNKFNVWKLMILEEKRKSNNLNRLKG